MKSNDYTSSFQLVSNFITDLNVKNDILFETADKSASRNVDVDPHILAITTHKEELIGAIELKICINIKKDDKQTNINLTIQGHFSADKDIKQTHFENLLTTNGASALYAIARGFIINISSQIYVGGKIVLPMLNFNQIEN